MQADLLDSICFIINPLSRQLSAAESLDNPNDSRNDSKNGPGNDPKDDPTIKRKQKRAAEIRI